MPCMSMWFCFSFVALPTQNVKYSLVTPPTAVASCPVTLQEPTWKKMGADWIGGHGVVSLSTSSSTTAALAAAPLRLCSLWLARL